MQIVLQIYAGLGACLQVYPEDPMFSPHRSYNRKHIHMKYLQNWTRARDVDRSYCS